MLDTCERLFHISETPGIKVFEPRPSPSHFEVIKGNVVFAITEKLLHNYLLPRDCPRVTFYSKHDTNQSDKEKFLRSTTSDYVIAVENKWYPMIREARLYCYEFSREHFIPVDEGAGYYISYQSEIPCSVRAIDDILAELLKKNVELRFMPSLWQFANEVSKSTLQYSLIRMRNASLS